MGIQFAVLSSGSEGNCFYIGTQTTAILVDAGLTWGETADRLELLKLDRRKIQAVAISHEHGDHRQGLRGLAKNMRWPVIASAGTMTALSKDCEEFLQPHDRRVIASEGYMDIGNLRVVSFRVDHDAIDPVGYFIQETGGKSVAIATDLSIIDEEQEFWLQEASLVSVESNFDRQKLERCRYHPDLKARIAATHMSNNDTAAAIRRFGKSSQRFVLGHISGESNSVELVKSIHYDDPRVEVVAPGQMSTVFVV